MSEQRSRQPAYEVFALRYATHSDRSSSENFLPEDPLHLSSMPLDFYVWLIRGHGRNILVDTGFQPELAVKRRRTYLSHPLQLLANLEVSPADITDVIVTHMHYDHAGNLPSFPNTRFHVQEAEMQYCTGRCMCHPLLRKPYEPADISAIVHGLHQGRVVFADGEQEIAPGIRTHLCGGHTNGLQFVTVSTDRGELVLTSDAVHYYANYARRHPFPSFQSLADMLDGYDRIASFAADLSQVIPGHDPSVSTAFPHYRSDPLIAELHKAPTGALLPDLDGGKR